MTTKNIVRIVIVAVFGMILAGCSLFNGGLSGSAAPAASSTPTALAAMPTATGSPTPTAALPTATGAAGYQPTATLWPVIPTNTAQPSPTATAVPATATTVPTQAPTATTAPTQAPTATAAPTTAPATPAAPTISITNLITVLNNNVTIINTNVNYVVVDVVNNVVIPCGYIPQWSGNPTNSVASDGTLVVEKGTRVTLYVSLSGCPATGGLSGTIGGNTGTGTAGGTAACEVPTNLDSGMLYDSLFLGINGPARNWVAPAQNADGSPVPGTFVFRDVHSDQAMGYEQVIPEGIIMHAWLNTPLGKKAMIIEGPARIENGYSVARATYYVTCVTYGMGGKWAYINNANLIVSDWTTVGTLPTQTVVAYDPIATMAQARTINPFKTWTGATFSTSTGTGSTGAATGTCNNIAALKLALSGKGTIVTETADYLVVDLSAEFVVPAGVVAQWSSNSGNSTPSDGSVRVPPGRVTLYPTCK